jgi:hydrogenase maturation protease
MNKDIKVLVYGYGNPGRQDDALGNKMVEKIEEWVEKHKIKNIETDSNYQLNVEDAERISTKDVVVFVDASQEEDVHEYKFTHLEPSTEKVEFTMHAVSPEYVLHICQDLFKKAPRTCLLGIKGFEWDFKEGLSDNAKLNLEQAFQFLTRKLEAYIDTDIHYPISML